MPLLPLLKRSFWLMRQIIMALACAITTSTSHALSSTTQNRRVVLPLDTAMERNLWARQEPPIATLTWFRMTNTGDDDDDDNDSIKRSIAALQNKTRHVMRLNPWLAGRVRGGDPWSLLVRQQPPQLEYYNSDDDYIDDDDDKYDKEAIPRFQQIFHHVQVDGGDLSPETALSDMYAATMPYTELDQTNGPLCRITVLESSDRNNNRLGIIFSMSHAVADMTAYYALLGMVLSSSSADNHYNDNIQPLCLDAIPQADWQARQSLGAAAFDLQHHVLANLVKGARGLATRFISGQPGKEQWYTVNQDVMAKEKERQAMQQTETNGSVDFVSTNDVLTSHFFQTCGANVGLLCVDYRHTILANCTTTMHQTWGRNRWGTIVFYQRPLLLEVAEPGMIRKSLTLLQQGYSLDTSFTLPTTLEFALNDDKIAVASSWVQKNPHWRIFGANEPFIAHVPLYDFSTYAPSGFCVMRTFTYDSKKQTGVYVAGDAEMVDLFTSKAPDFLRPM